MKKIVIVLIFLGMIICLSAQSPWLGSDKVTHFTASAFLTYWNYGMSKDFGQQNARNSLIFSVNLTAFMGAGKEFSDKYILKSEWDWHDIAYDLAGICAGMILINNME
ncbi:MAG TPA: hypothetical protein PLD62_08400 [Candidatus Cloacimonadota bacterium]|nr:hypothetical protein [Candidatus Cloacimonadota bacterium]